MARNLTPYERERVEQLLQNWVQSKLGGGAISGYATSSIYADQIEGRAAYRETRYPVIQVDADRVNAVVFGRAATQLLPAIEPMRDALQVTLIMYYLEELTQEKIARILKIARQTVVARLANARWLIWESVNQKVQFGGNPRQITI